MPTVNPPKMGITGAAQLPRVTIPFNDKKVKSNNNTVVRRFNRHIFGDLTKLSGATMKEIAAECNMDFIAFKRPQFFYEDDNSETQIVNPEKVAIINGNTGDYIGTVGTNYGLVQYIDALKFVEPMIEEGEASALYGTIVGKGRRAYLVLKTAEFMEPVPGERIECYFYVTAAHDGTSSVSIVPAPVRVANDSSFNWTKPIALKFKHSKHVMDRMARSRKTLSKVKEYWDHFEESFKLLGKVTVDNKDVETYLLDVFPNPKENPTRAENIRGKIEDLIRTEPSLQVPSLRGTLLQAYFAVIHYYDFYTIVKDTGKDEFTARVEAKMGPNASNAKDKAECLAMALDLAKTLGA